MCDRRAHSTLVPLFPCSVGGLWADRAIMCDDMGPAGGIAICCMVILSAVLFGVSWGIVLPGEVALNEDTATWQVEPDTTYGPGK